MHVRTSSGIHMSITALRYIWSSSIRVCEVSFEVHSEWKNCYQITFTPLRVIALVVSIAQNKKKVKFKFPLWGLIQYWNLMAYCTLDPKGVSSFISRGAARQAARTTSASEGRNYIRNLSNNLIFHLSRFVLLHAAKLGLGTDAFTSPPKEGMLRVFTLVKIQRLRPDSGIRNQHANH
jgi:hypothetical protein